MLNQNSTELTLDEIIASLDLNLVLNQKDIVGIVNKFLSVKIKPVKDSLRRHGWQMKEMKGPDEKNRTVRYWFHPDNVLISSRLLLCRHKS